MHATWSWLTGFINGFMLLCFYSFLESLARVEKGGRGRGEGGLFLRKQ